MSENPPYRPDDEPRPPGTPGQGPQPDPQPSPQQPGPQHPAPPYGAPPPHGGQPPYGDQPYAQQPAGGPPGGGVPSTAYPGNEVPPDRSAYPVSPASGNFFGALFDYSFTRYITPGVVTIVYVVVTVLVALVWLGGLVAAFQESIGFGIAYLLLAWIVALVYLALARITLEFFVAVISVSEKVNAYAKRDGIS